MRVVPKIKDGIVTAVFSYTDVYSSLCAISSIPKKLLEKYIFSNEKVESIYNINDRRNAKSFKIESFKDGIFNVLIPKDREKEFYSTFVFSTVLKNTGGEFDIIVSGHFPMIFFEVKLNPVIIENGRPNI